MSNVTIQKQKRPASLKIQRRRQRLIVLYNTIEAFTVDKAAKSLCTSRWTVKRDMDFLKQHDLLSPRKKRAFPFELAESAAEFCARFNVAHNIYSNTSRSIRVQ